MVRKRLSCQWVTRHRCVFEQMLLLSPARCRTTEVGGGHRLLVVTPLEWEEATAAHRPSASSSQHRVRLHRICSANLSVGPHRVCRRRRRSFATSERERGEGDPGILSRCQPADPRLLSAICTRCREAETEAAVLSVPPPSSLLRRVRGSGEREG
ncbi:hypothetical protein E2562_006886 [Oryza meyeriana var. granulata]|uniref:Uncharacterized protein n=1 Tax=Oryza meyeriana var. granulata TaxID=110450 RepID=A0A6G1BJD8_9ORYZ|nr:hypothetical protein E2562_006886 [Oryza meyeriana var. granulata]